MVEGENDTKIFGFWLYLMTDLVMFAVFFATYVVLHNNTFGGPSAKELISMPFALSETLILLTSSFTCSLATLAVIREEKNWVLFWFVVTFALGLCFLYLELSEFSSFIQKRAGPQRSGFLSSFFALVGTHGLHITVGLLWMFTTLITVWFRGLTKPDISRIFRLALFWHFLDVVWIFIFTIVYAMGRLSYA
jgi:cytochrome o ubiquinol oxidase subunit 3